MSLLQWHTIKAWWGKQWACFNGTRNLCAAGNTVKAWLGPRKLCSPGNASDSEPATMANTRQIVSLLQWHIQKPCSSGNALNNEPATMTLTHGSPAQQAYSQGLMKQTVSLLWWQYSQHTGCKFNSFRS